MKNLKNLKAVTELSNESRHFSRRSFLSTAVCAPLILLLPQTAAAASVIHELVGDVYLNKHKLGANSIIKSGDEIVVPEDGKLVFSMGGDAFLLRGNSVMTVHHEKNNPLVSSLRLLTGAMLAVFAKRSHTTRLVTATATIGIRGTAVYMDAKPHQLYTCTCYGRTTLQVGKHSEDVIATHHSAHTVARGASGHMQMQAFEVIDHTDDELRMLEALVGRKPLFDV